MYFNFQEEGKARLLVTGRIYCHIFLEQYIKIAHLALYKWLLFHNIEKINEIIQWLLYIT